MSSSAPVPSVPALSLPPRLRAGDALLIDVQTQLPAGTLVFVVLNAVIGNVPVRQMLGPSQGVAGVAVDANGIATLTEASAVTAKWLPGRYLWVLFAVDGNGNRTEQAQGELVVEPDPAGPTPVDPRSYNEKVLGSIRDLLAGKALDDVGMYKVGGREVTTLSLSELLKWEGVMEDRVRREHIRKGQRVPNQNLGISFGGRT